MYAWIKLNIYVLTYYNRALWRGHNLWSMFFNVDISINIYWMSVSMHTRARELTRPICKIYSFNSGCTQLLMYACTLRVQDIWLFI